MGETVLQPKLPSLGDYFEPEIAWIGSQPLFFITTLQVWALQFHIQARTKKKAKL